MPAGYYRFPTIYNDYIVYVCEDDLWSVPAVGGISRRLTSNLGEASRPSLSPDGSLVAFVGRDEGESDIYVMPALGGPARRITYMGGSLCTTAGWTPDNEILFANNAEHWYLRYTKMYTIDPTGHNLRELKIGPVRTISYGPSGGVVIGRNTDDPARWKRYRGGRAGQLWVDQEGKGEFSSLIRLEGDLSSPIWIAGSAPGGRIFFISDHEGIGNLYSCTPAGDDLQRHTDHKEYYARNASSDGKKIVYHAGADLFVYDIQQDSSHMVQIEHHSPQVHRNRKFVHPGRYLQDYELHPKGQHLAITSRGKLFNFANWEGAVIQHGELAQPAHSGTPVTGIRYRTPQWLKDGKRLIAITDEGGEEHFVIFNSDGSGEPQHLPNLDIGRPDALKINPKFDQVIFSNHRYEIMYLDLETGELRVIDRGKANPVSGFDWSPDGLWVVYSISLTFQTAGLKLWNVEQNVSYPLTYPVLRDIAPVFEPNGKYIYFLSHRIFDPIYDNMQFDLGFPMGMKPYLITLQSDSISPFIPQPKVDEDDEKEDEEQEQTKESKNNAQDQEQSADSVPGEEDEHEGNKDSGIKEEDQPIQIDLEGIQHRVIEFPIPEGIYGKIMATKDGKVLYTRDQPFGAMDTDFLQIDEPSRRNLYLYNFEEQKEEHLAGGVTDFSISSDGKTLIYREGKRLRVLKAGEKPPTEKNSPSRKSGWIDLNRVKVPIIPGSEWRQMFREAWRLQRDQFWTEDMSKIDWIAVHDRYLPLVDRVSSRSEFSDLMWEMQGELGTSHCYEFGGDYRPEPSYRQGYLGAEFEFQEDSGGWKVVKVHQGDVWDEAKTSPFTRPGVNIQEGDTLLAINGRKLSRTITPAAALVNLAGEEIVLQTISGQAEGDGELAERFVTVKSLSSEMPLRYREWVENNRRTVHEQTHDRVGYVHIPDMGPYGYAEFHRYYLSEVDRQGLLIDVRYNRGGHVSALLLEKLARRRIGYDTSRWSQIPMPYPPESVMGPMVALTNEYAGSDGDIFSHGFKLFKLGPLIGTRTWGGVIGIWPRHSLVDGTVTTQPEFSFWFYDVGWGVENYGTDPDIVVENTPQDYTREVDRQLNIGIEEILKLLESNPPELPDFSNRPDLSLPKLPPR